MTTREGWPEPATKAIGSASAVSPYDQFNLGDHVGDDPHAVAERRTILVNSMSGHAVWLKQVHGNCVVRLSSLGTSVAIDGVAGGSLPVSADGSFTTEPGIVCTVMVADCLPVLLAAPDGKGVAALHAGWRGLLGAGHGMGGIGILETGVQALCEATHCTPSQLQAWLGPCIGPQAFEVGDDVRQASGKSSLSRFSPVPGAVGKWWADLPGLAIDRLQALGVCQVTGGQWCTVSDPGRFFSFRRDGVTGRQAACIRLR
jgi:polyphenol oxidase